MLKIKFPILKKFQNGREICFGDKNTSEQLIEAGFMYNIFGNNGTGKTTFMNILSFLTESSNGICISDDNICFGLKNDSKLDRAKLRASIYSFIFQDPHLINIYTIKENLSIVNNKFNYDRDLAELASKVMSLKGLSDDSTSFILTKIQKFMKEKNDTPFYLSGGEKQLISFIRSMIKPSNVIFADEPWASMDNHLKTFIESQMYAYLSDSDIFASIRNRHPNLKNKKVVFVISHPNHLTQSDKKFGGKDESWTNSIPVYKDNKQDNLHTIRLERYLKL